MYNAIIVEDDLAVMTTDRKYLREYRQFDNIYTFRRADEALDFTLKNKIDLIILDYHLPGFNGDVFLKELRYAGNHAEVVVTTMDASMDAAVAMLYLGIMNYIIKPFTRDRFREAVDFFLRIAPIKEGQARVSQIEMDVYIKKLSNKPHETKLSKGLRWETYEMLHEYIKENSIKNVRLDKLVDDTGLSKVTLRRYMNEFHEKGIIDIAVDYDTGGRPSILYTYKSDIDYWDDEAE